MEYESLSLLFGVEDVIPNVIELYNDPTPPPEVTLYIEIVPA